MKKSYGQEYVAAKKAHKMFGIKKGQAGRVVDFLDEDGKTTEVKVQFYGLDRVITMVPKEVRFIAHTFQNVMAIELQLQQTVLFVVDKMPTRVTIDMLEYDEDEDTVGIYGATASGDYIDISLPWATKVVIADE
jgi:hypothetical protein